MYGSVDELRINIFIILQDFERVGNRSLSILLNCLIEPISGNIYIDGEDIFKLRERRNL